MDTEITIWNDPSLASPEAAAHALVSCVWHHPCLVPHFKDFRPEQIIAAGDYFRFLSYVTEPETSCIESHENLLKVHLPHIQHYRAMATEPS